MGGTPDTVPVLDPVTTDEDWMSSPEAYGAMKVACEDIVRAGAASSVVIRPGPDRRAGDPSGRFTYWPVRLAEPGPVLARRPTTSSRRSTYATWRTGWSPRPSSASRACTTGWGADLRADFLAEVARGVSPAEPAFVWASEEQLAAQSVEPWAGPRSLPVWVPGADDRGFMAHDVTPSLAAGLRLRPLAETARDTLAWVALDPRRDGHRPHPRRGAGHPRRPRRGVSSCGPKCVFLRAEVCVLATPEHTGRVIDLDLGPALRDAGLAWTPTAGDRFVVLDRDLDDQVFVVSDMVIEARETPSGPLLAFNGTTEWALDSLQVQDAVWLPREDQLRELLGAAFVSLESAGGGAVPAGFAVTVRVAGAEHRHLEVAADAAYARALLDLLA